jgi:nucleoside-diphosphate-sugar epimerase
LRNNGAMIVLVAGAHGRLGRRVVALLLASDHAVRALARTPAQADSLESTGAQPVLADVRGDVEWTAEGCDAAIFAAGARHRSELPAVDGGGAAKLAEAADRYELQRFVMCSAIGGGVPEKRQGLLREFLSAKHAAERRVERLDMPWTILRFGGLSEAPGDGRISTRLEPGAPVSLNRDDAALAIVEALPREHLGHQVVHVVDGDRHVSDALDAVEPRPLPPVRPSGSGPYRRTTRRTPPTCFDRTPRRLTPMSTTRATVRSRRS